MSQNNKLIFVTHNKGKVESANTLRGIWNFKHMITILEKLGVKVLKRLQ